MTGRRIALLAIVTFICVAVAWEFLESSTPASPPPGLVAVEPAEPGTTLPHPGPLDVVEVDPGPARRLAASGLSPAAHAELFLRVVDEADGRSVASRVDLWSLTAGAQDELVRRDVEVAAEGQLLGDLPPGLYRAHVRARRRDTTDPPAFLLSAPRTEVDLMISSARRHGAVLALFDEQGHRLRMARMVSGYRPMPAVGRPFVDREVPGPPGTDGDDGFLFGWRQVSAEADDVFRLATVSDLDCDRGGEPWFEFSPLSRSPVDVELTGYELRSEVGAGVPDDVLVFVGLSPTDGLFDDMIRLPGGLRALDDGALIEVRCTALEVPPDEELDAVWPDVPVSVSVSHPGYETVDFEWRPRDGLPRTVTLVPAGR